MYKYENGFSEKEKEAALAGNSSLEFIEVAPNTYYMRRHAYNSSALTCYKKVRRLQDGKMFNVNLNNGIAYDI